jgi:hypothetical protein
MDTPLGFNLGRYVVRTRTGARAPSGAVIVPDARWVLPALLPLPPLLVYQTCDPLRDPTKEGGPVEARYYSIESLEAELSAFEERYGLTSEELLVSYRADEVPSHIPSFEAFVWADTYLELGRLKALAEPQPA